MKYRKVVPFRNVHHKLFADALLGEVGRELLSQQACVSPHNAVFTGVISGMAMENMNADLLLRGLFRGFTDSTVSYIEKEVTQARRRLQVRARGNALNQDPTRVSLNLATDFGS